MSISAFSPIVTGSFRRKATFPLPRWNTTARSNWVSRYSSSSFTKITRSSIEDVETGPGAEKLKALKDRIGEARVAAFFKSPEDLRAHVVEALREARQGNRRRRGRRRHREHRREAPPQERDPRAARALYRPSLYASAAPRPRRPPSRAQRADGLGRQSRLASLWRADLLPRRDRRHGQERAHLEMVQPDRAQRDEAARRPVVVELLRKRCDFREFPRPRALLCERRQRGGRARLALARARGAAPASASTKSLFSSSSMVWSAS